MTDKQGWLFTILTALIVSPAIYNEFALTSDERATPAMRVVTPKGQTKANLMPHNMAEGVLNLSNTPASFNELGHGQRLASPNLRVAQPRNLASSTWAGQPGGFFGEWAVSVLVRFAQETPARLGSGDVRTAVVGGLRGGLA